MDPVAIFPIYMDLDANPDTLPAGVFSLFTNRFQWESCPVAPRMFETDCFDWFVASWSICQEHLLKIIKWECKFKLSTQAATHQQKIIKSFVNNLIFFIHAESVPDVVLSGSGFLSGPITEVTRVNLLYIVVPVHARHNNKKMLTNHLSTAIYRYMRSKWWQKIYEPLNRSRCVQKYDPDLTVYCFWRRDAVKPCMLLPLSVYMFRWQESWLWREALALLLNISARELTLSPAQVCPHRHGNTGTI